jgi:hypothetical protein
MIAAVVRFEVKDEAKNQLADTNAARKHIRKVAEVPKYC